MVSMAIRGEWQGLLVGTFALYALAMLGVPGLSEFAAELIAVLACLGGFLTIMVIVGM